MVNTEWIKRFELFSLHCQVLSTRKHLFNFKLLSLLKAYKLEVAAGVVAAPAACLEKSISCRSCRFGFVVAALVVLGVLRFHNNRVRDYYLIWQFQH